MSFEALGTLATLPRTTRGIPIVLGGDPKGKNFLYVNGNSVIIRDIANPSICDIYTEHSTAATVAKYSPSGFYIASADVSGKVRIWDTTQKEHILKNEYQPFAGQVKDLAWSGDSQRICVVGEGRAKYGHVFNADTGASVGEIMGQSKSLNSVDFKPQRPFRLVTASEDNTVAYFEGPPFKFKFTHNDHTRFANVVRYAPSGDVFISGGADGKAFIYEGKTGLKKGELGSPAHAGGIYGISFSPDSKQVLTASADKSAKIWDLESESVVQTFVIGKDLDDMQVGCLWQGDFLLSVSLSGHINYLDRNNPDKPQRIIKGHNKPITAMALSGDSSTVYTGSSDGLICQWDVLTGHNDVVQGKGHTNQIQDMAIVDDTLFSVGIDDAFISTSTHTNQYGLSTKLGSQPKGLAVASGGLAVVACLKEVSVLRNGRVVFSQKESYEPQCAAIHPGLTEVAVGGTDDKVHLYTLSGDTLQPAKVLEVNGPVGDLKYSPDGAYLAVAAAKRIQLFSLPGYECVISSHWSHHTARVNSISWTSNSRQIASGALDTQIIIWNPEHKLKNIPIKGAHKQSQVTRVGWLDDNTIVSVGQDSCLKKWKITHM